MDDTVKLLSKQKKAERKERNRMEGLIAYYQAIAQNPWQLRKVLRSEIDQKLFKQCLTWLDNKQVEMDTEGADMRKMYREVAVEIETDTVGEITAG